MAATRKVYYQSLQIGDEIPSWQCPPIDRLQIVRYAGASGDFNPLYFDEPFARAAGFRSVLVPGALTLGALAQMVNEWLKGPSLRKLHARFLKISWPGESLTCRGRVVGRRREGSNYLIELDLWIENPEGEMTVRGSGTAVLFHSAQDEAQRLAGGPPLLIDDPPAEGTGAPAAKKGRADTGKGAGKHAPARKVGGKSQR